MFFRKLNYFSISNFFRKKVIIDLGENTHKFFVNTLLILFFWKSRRVYPVIDLNKRFFYKFSIFEKDQYNNRWLPVHKLLKIGWVLKKLFDRENFCVLLIKNKLLQNDPKASIVYDQIQKKGTKNLFSFIVLALSIIF
jgi:hypothetical protein